MTLSRRTSEDIWNCLTFMAIVLEFPPDLGFHTTSPATSHNFKTLLLSWKSHQNLKGLSFEKQSLAPGWVCASQSGQNTRSGDQWFYCCLEQAEPDCYYRYLESSLEYTRDSYVKQDGELAWWRSESGSRQIRMGAPGLPALVKRCARYTNGSITRPEYLQLGPQIFEPLSNLDLSKIGDL